MGPGKTTYFDAKLFRPILILSKKKPLRNQLTHKQNIAFQFATRGGNCQWNWWDRLDETEWNRMELSETQWNRMELSEAQVELNGTEWNN